MKRTICFRPSPHTTFRLHLKPTFDFRQELLSLGDDVEVLQPEWFRQEVK